MILYVIIFTTALWINLFWGWNRIRVILLRGHYAPRRFKSRSDRVIIERFGVVLGEGNGAVANGTARAGGDIFIVDVLVIMS